MGSNKPRQGGGGSSGYDELVLQLKRTNLAKNQMEDTVVSLLFSLDVHFLLMLTKERCWQSRNGVVA
jgi:hypothetical protein